MKLIDLAEQMQLAQGGNVTAMQIILQHAAAMAGLLEVPTTQSSEVRNALIADLQGVISGLEKQTVPLTLENIKTMLGKQYRLEPTDTPHWVVCRSGGDPLFTCYEGISWNEFQQKMHGWCD
ncbi:hypothetical protein ACQ4M3_37170 [Leptolyngbya sp. AN03gr2]|uniref:hypothetical protein n=1 Tax=unclassified Leptolyngbya TaxID=2650499 RepID=UPI003D317F79